MTASENAAFPPLKRKYGGGEEARTAHAVREMPEIRPFLNSRDSKDPANIYLQQLLGSGQVRMRVMRAVVRELKRWFPDIETCPRSRVRIWAGCAWYLTRHSDYVMKARERGLLGELLKSYTFSKTEISSQSDWEGRHSRPLLPRIHDIIPYGLPLCQILT
jgi:hypothetical protein